MKHTYSDLIDTPMWKTIQKAIRNLIKNQDIELTTNEEKVVGYLCIALKKKKKRKNKE